MAFPFISEVNFEGGTLGSFDAETDTDSKLDFPHYSELARTPGIAMPYSGAYCMRIDLSGGTNDAYVQENADWDMSASETQHWRFMLWVDPNTTMANTNEFSIFELVATSTTEAACVINYTTANGFRIGIGETGGTNFLPLPTNKWVSVELSVTLDSGAGNDGTIDLYVDGAAATQVASLDQGAITLGRLGAMNLDAGTTAGVILFDSVISDDARVYPPVHRWQDEVRLTASGHAFVGPGQICNITLNSGAGTDNVVTVYDTDVANTNDASNTPVILKNTANNETVDPAGMPVNIRRGCYVDLSGTNPQATVKISRAVAWGSDAAVRNYGLKRTAARMGV